MTEPGQTDETARLRDLEARIAKARGPQTPVKSHQEEHYSQAQLAWRMVIELVAGLAIGFGIGYGLDALLGTRPIFLVVFIFFGFAAGINVMLRSAKEVGARQARSGPADDTGAPPRADDTGVPPRSDDNGAPPQSDRNA